MYSWRPPAGQLLVGWRRPAGKYPFDCSFTVETDRIASVLHLDRSTPVRAKDMHSMLACLAYGTYGTALGHGGAIGLGQGYPAASG
jgi:hypothetical protein